MSNDPEFGTDAEPPETADGDFDLCLCCLKENPPDALMCRHCGAPIDGLATYLPFVSVWAEGFLYRRAATHCTKPITLIGIWVCLGLPAIGMLWFYSRPDTDVMDGTHSYVSYTETGIAFFFLLLHYLLSLAVVIRTTACYFRNRARDADGG